MKIGNYSSSSDSYIKATTNPSIPTPARRPNSIRRTSHLLTTWPNGYYGELRINGIGRDLLTPVSPKEPEIVNKAELSAIISPQLRLLDITAEPGPDLTALIGGDAKKGLRRAINKAFSSTPHQHSLAYFLVDDLPIATLISTFAWSRRTQLLKTLYKTTYEPPEIHENICSGYRTGGLAITSRREKSLQTPSVTFAEPTGDDEDGLAWHEFSVPKELAMCRRRRVDIWVDDVYYTIEAMFRDNTWEPNGTEAIIHEYTLTALIDPQRLTLTKLAVTPRVLPYPECSLAAAEVQRCIGFEVKKLRTSILATLRGVESCTHLNDMLRSIAEIPSLIPKIAP